MKHTKYRSPLALVATLGLVLVAPLSASATNSPHRYTNTSRQVVQLTYHDGACLMQGDLYLGQNYATTWDGCGQDISRVRHYYGNASGGGWTVWAWSYWTATSPATAYISQGEHYETY